MRRSAAVTFIAAIVVPIALWHHVIGDTASQFRLELGYLLVGCAPWLLMAAGLACAATAGVIEWRRRDRRFYTASGAAWAGWGVSLYILGFALATQVAQIHDGFTRV